MCWMNATTQQSQLSYINFKLFQKIEQELLSLLDRKPEEQN